MAVHKSSTVSLPVGPSVVLPWLEDLARYPEWMPLVHAATPVAPDVWDVELRATLGIFARSKKLRMRRTAATGGRIVFEREENDGRVHAPWTLEVRVDGDDRHCSVTMDMTYGGTLWTAGVLDKVLAQHIELGKQGISRVVQGA